MLRIQSHARNISKASQKAPETFENLFFFKHFFFLFLHRPFLPHFWKERESTIGWYLQNNINLTPLLHMLWILKCFFFPPQNKKSKTYHSIIHYIREKISIKYGQIIQCKYAKKFPHQQYQRKNEQKHGTMYTISIYCRLCISSKSVVCLWWLAVLVVLVILGLSRWALRLFRH